MNPLLELDDLHVDRGRSTVLRGLSLTVDRGEVVVVTGPNGAGKTTLVETIAGLLRPQSGRIRLDGAGIDDRSVAWRARSGIGVTPERRRLFPSLTVRDNLLVAAGTWGLGARAARTRIDELAEDSPVVGDKIDAVVRTLSGGQQQIVAIARSLLCSPDLLILDEPSIGLSPRAWSTVVRRCRDLADRGHGVLLVEQRVLDVTPIATTVLVLHQGRARTADPEELATGRTYFGDNAG